MKEGININIQKKDLWLLSAICVFLVGSGIIIAFNPGLSGGTPAIMGHSSDEILVDFNGSIRDLQDALYLIEAGGGFGGSGMAFGDWVDVTSSASTGTIQGPVATDGFVIASKVQNGDVTACTSASSTNPVCRVRSTGGAYAWTGPITMPVKKGEYWSITAASYQDKIYWIPLISSGSAPWIEYGPCQRGGQAYVDYFQACEFRICTDAGCSAWKTGSDRIVTPTTASGYW